jgi:hypothetical protein
MIPEVGLWFSVIAAGLWSGLMLTLTTILHPMFASREAGAFAEDMRRFLPIAHRSPTNYILVLALVIAPTLALIGLRRQPTSAPYHLNRGRIGHHHRQTPVDLAILC